ncbi:hypothetical protein OB2597_03017 [Pseudooceanicola batsensis HTCC2597]|uniref:DUF6456 domain-containing protein n=1 Tax=Pseudooceanicola batsensis (strain ATCC BAA-863 / DSM 15984 / KCTC 12145 / HTCC2597) TaxID=252305 RepID=A3TXJ7_PSEBH|nr:DUF6456 domain-containing protein [Pseudooceanicola batsensis]EAQ03557.1 hypothetical protein OB2597_03017 [Pseudooceanicola batsensis HTCC2597]
MTQHVQQWIETWPDWVPEPIRRYVAHKDGKSTIRSLARAEGCHASTVLRQIRQVESARDDLLIDEAIRWLGAQTVPVVCAPSERLGSGLPGFKPGEDAMARPELEERAIPALRGLSNPGAVLAVSAEMDRAVIVRNTPAGEAHRLGVVDRRVAQALALNRWIICTGSGALCRYRVSALGRSVLKSLIARAENRAGGFSGGTSRFPGQPAAEPPARRRLGLPETPVLALARRRDRNGVPFLPAPLVRAAERIQDDFELAQMEPRVATNWDDYLTAGTSGPGGGTDTAVSGAAAARARVSSALRALGPGLGDVVLECCCRLQGLERAEKKLGWSARSGKIVLRIALQRLRQHYDGLNDGGGLIG